MILVTGGAGYIGSHTVLALLDVGYEVLILDNLVNSSPETIHRLKQISGKDALFVKGDVRDRQLLDQVFGEYNIEAVIHFAGLKAVGESVHKPLAYYDNNVRGSVCLLEAMQHAGVHSFVFSSSATVYGDPGSPEYVESMPLGNPSSPYGQSKKMVEQILQDLLISDDTWSVASLRYFNPVGAHQSGLIGEDPLGIPNNLLPFIAQVAVGRLEKLAVFGDDYPTPDGTCLRDYIHVLDLAEGHVRALDAIKNKQGLFVWNLGSGQPHSVLEMVKAFQEASGKQIPYVITPRRAGDLPAFWANADKAAKELGWRAERTLEDMMVDTWRWQSKNPNGYRG